MAATETRRTLFSGDRPTASCAPRYAPGTEIDAGPPQSEAAGRRRRLRGTKPADAIKSALVASRISASVSTLTVPSDRMTRFVQPKDLFLVGPAKLRIVAHGKVNPRSGQVRLGPADPQGSANPLRYNETGSKQEAVHARETRRNRQCVWSGTCRIHNTSGFGSPLRGGASEVLFSASQPNLGAGRQAVLGIADFSRLTRPS